jgi:hypothetical protein
MLGLAVIPSRPAADRDGQRSSVEGPPFTVSKEVALVTRTDAIRQELDDRLRLLEIISEVRLDQLGNTFRALAGSPLVAPPLAETQIVRDNALQRANFSLEFTSLAQMRWHAARCPLRQENIYRPGPREATPTAVFCRVGALQDASIPRLPQARREELWALLKFGYSGLSCGELAATKASL